MKRSIGFTLVELMVGLIGLAALSILIGGIYVAIHFIRKFW